MLVYGGGRGGCECAEFAYVDEERFFREEPETGGNRSAVEELTQ